MPLLDSFSCEFKAFPKKVSSQEDANREVPFTWDVFVTLVQSVNVKNRSSSRIWSYHQTLE
jgi:hypothetical protein